MFLLHAPDGINVYRVQDVGRLVVLFLSRTPARFLSVCETWIYRLLPALHAHLPCTTILNSEECALSEKKKKNIVLV